MKKELEEDIVGAAPGAICDVDPKDLIEIGKRVVKIWRDWKK